jgi:NAD(P)-dependent dehydrogenase (short-subunit alcohol dehydrogenase family)
MATYLITGCGRGIGLELVTQLLHLPTSEISLIIALTRAAPSAPLQALLDSNSPRLKHITANVSDTASVVAALGAVKAELGGKGLDVLVNNAGIADYTPGGPKDVSPQTMADIFEVNVVGVQRMTATFLPLLEMGELKRVINVYVQCSAVQSTFPLHFSPNAT